MHRTSGYCGREGARTTLNPPRILYLWFVGRTIISRNKYWSLGYEMNYVLPCSGSKCIRGRIERRKIIIRPIIMADCGAWQTDICISICSFRYISSIHLLGLVGVIEIELVKGYNASTIRYYNEMQKWRL